MNDKNKDLRLVNTMRLSRVASEYRDARSREDLIKARKYSIENNVPLLVLGGGSNTLFFKDFNGLVVRNLYMKMEVVSETDSYVDLLVSSGLPVARLVTETTEKGYEGFEYHQGLPGSAGGAIYMNSKWTKPLNYFGDRLLYGNIIDKDGNIKKVERDYFQFKYDYSRLQETGDILLEAVFHLPKVSPDILKKRAKESLEYRKKTQPHGVSTSGCIFQNVNGESAGKMIDQAGLKGAREGAFVVSDLHANFIINEGNGNSEDLKRLIERIKQTVKDKFGVELKEEVRIIV